MAQENPSGANPFDARPRSLKTRTSTRSVFPEHHRCPEVPPDRLRGGRPRLRERDPVQKHGHQVWLLPCGAGPAAAGGGSEEHQAGPEDPGHHAAGTSGAHGESSRERGAQQDRVPTMPGCPGQPLPCHADVMRSCPGPTWWLTTVTLVRGSTHMHTCTDIHVDMDK